MTWSYRMVRDEHGMVGIKEVYWRRTAADLPASELTYEHAHSWTEGFMYPYGEGEDDFRKDFEMMLLATNRPILDEAKMVESVKKNKKEILQEYENEMMEDNEEFEL